MLRQRITKSITCIVAIALFAWSKPVAAYDIGAEAPPSNPRDRGNLSVVADDAEGNAYGLPPEEILSMVAFDAEDSTYGDGLLREDMLAVARAKILANHVNRIASGVFYDANEKSGYGLLSEQPVDDECDLC